MKRSFSEETRLKKFSSYLSASVRVCGLDTNSCALHATIAPIHAHTQSARSGRSLWARCTWPRRSCACLSTGIARTFPSLSMFWTNFQRMCVHIAVYTCICISRAHSKEALAVFCLHVTPPPAIHFTITIESPAPSWDPAAVRVFTLTWRKLQAEAEAICCL